MTLLVQYLLYHSKLTDTNTKNSDLIISTSLVVCIV